MQECLKDKRQIDYKLCFELMAAWNIEDLTSTLNAYTKESILHVWCYQGHLELIEEFPEKQLVMASLVDINSNTPFHSLCQNSTSQENELIAIFQYLRQYKVRTSQVNNDGATGLDILMKRIKDRNPYDGNLAAIRLLYWNILDSLSQKEYEKASKSKDFMPKDNILQISESLSDLGGSFNGGSGRKTAKVHRMSVMKGQSGSLKRIKTMKD